MRERMAPALGAGLVAAMVLASAPAAAAEEASALQAQIEQLRRHMEDSQAAYQQQIQALEARIHELEDRSAEAAAQPAPAPAPAASPAAPVGANAFNPAIGVVLQGTVAKESRDPDRYRIPGFALGEEAPPPVRGLGIGESEITAQANIDQELFGALTLSLERDNEPSVEEAYLQTTSLPEGFTLKGGRFFSDIGYLNRQHSHVWDFVDAPLPYRAILGNQYGDDGVQLTWLAPTDLYLEFGGELFRGDGFPAAGAENHGFGTWTGFVHAGDDIGVESSWRAGLSFLDADAKDRATNEDMDLFTGHERIGIVDVVYKWAPNGNPVERNLKLQGEFMLGSLDGNFNGIPFSQDQRGAYLQAIYQFMPRWRVGVREDAVWTHGDRAVLAGTALDGEGVVPRRTSAMIDYSTSEFGRFRLQYNYDQSQPEMGADHEFFLQYNVSLGAHGAHAY